jgi:hypothetical protein
VKKIVIVAAVAALAAPFIFAPSAQAATTYKSCSALQKKYPYGAGVKSAKDKVKPGFSAIKNFKVVSTSVYNASKKLDTDKDKILCELPKYKNCTYLNKKYPHGMGIKGAVDKVSGTAKKVTNFTVVSAALYNTNSTSDRDKDKIACEKL